MSALTIKNGPDRQAAVLLTRMGAPIFCSQLATPLMHFADAWMVAPLGTNVLAAILPAGLMYYVVISLILGVLHTVNTFVAQCFGENRYRDCSVYTWQAIWLSVFFAILILPVCLLPAEFFMLFGHTAKVAALERTYFSISVFGAGPLLISMALSNFFIGIQRPRIPMAAAFIALIANIFFNWIFIYGYMGAPALGIAGSALGTVLATVLMMVILFAWFLAGPVAVRYSARAMRLRKLEFCNLLRIGAPSGVQSVIDIAAWGVVMIWFIGRFGTVDQAATTIVVRYLHIALLPVLGLGGALTALVGQAVGAGDHGRARVLNNTAILMGVSYMSVVAIGFVIFREPMVRLFTDHHSIWGHASVGHETPQEVVTLAASLLCLIAVFVVGQAIQLLYGSSLRAVGDTHWIALWTFGLCALFMGVGGALCITVWQQFGSFGPWTCGALYIWMLAIVFVLRWHGKGWTKVRIFEGCRRNGDSGMAS